MKKRVVGLMTIALLAVCLIASCQLGDAPDKTADARFVSYASVSRGLNRTEPSFDPDNLYWMYEAHKTDDSGLKTGETTIPEFVGSEGTTGLSAAVGPFSLGVWKFTLYGYTDEGYTNLAYKGTVANVVIKKMAQGSTNTVSVKVKALQDGTGTLSLDDAISLHDANGNTISKYDEILTLTYLGEGTGNQSKVPVTTEPGYTQYTLTSGPWQVNIVYRSKMDPDIEYGNNTIFVNIFDNQTTYVRGNLDEITSDAEFTTTAEGGVKPATVTEPIAAEAPTTITVPSSPAEAHGAEDQHTQVILPQGAVTGTSASLDIVTYAAPVAADKFVITAEDTGAVIGGIDIDLTVDGTAKKDFGDNKVEVSTYIAKGLAAKPVVKYNGGEGDPDPADTVYDKDTGKLTFKTSHFSEYYVLADVEAYNATTNTGYATLKEAAAAGKAGEVIRLLKDIENTDYRSAKVITISLNGSEIDGGGHSLSGNINIAVKPAGGTIRNIVFNYIHNDVDETDHPRWKFPSTKIGGLTAVYGSNLTGKLVIEGCTFNTFDWEGIQITPLNGAEIRIIGNTFRFDADNSLGIVYPLRNIHVESDGKCDFTAVITGNVLLDNNQLYQTGLEVYYPKNLSKIMLSGNYIDSPVGVCIYDGNVNEINELVLPFSAGPNGEKALDARCYTYDTWGNVFFYEDFDAAVANCVDKVVLIDDVVATHKIPENVIVENNGHSISWKWDGTATAKEDLPVVTTEAGTTIDIDNPQDFAGIMAHVSEYGKDADGNRKALPLTINLTASIDLGGHDWTPAHIDGYTAGAGLITINGNGHTIFNLTVNAEGEAGLFSSSWAGDSSLIINDLTLRNANVIGDKDDNHKDGPFGVGAFIGCIEASSKAEFNNCRLIDSHVEGGHWTGGIYGTGNGHLGAGSVFTNILVSGTEISNTTVIGKGSAGGIAGHATRDAWSQLNVEHSKLSDVTITSTGSSDVKAGSIVGTVGAAGTPTEGEGGVVKTGGIYVNETVVENAAVTSNGTPIDRIYGRQGTSTGKLWVDGVEVVF